MLTHSPIPSPSGNILFMLAIVVTIVIDKITRK